MEEPSTEPSIEPSTHAPAAAVASEGAKVASLEKENLAGWPAFRSAIADTWPDGFPNANETACKAEFAKLRRSTPAGVLIEIARLHGQALTRRAATRPKSAGRQLIKEPSNWLRSGDWKGYSTAAEEARQAEAEITTRLGDAQRGLGIELFNMLRYDLRMTDAALSYLADCSFEPGPPPVLLVAGGAAWMMLDKHRLAFERRFGEGFRMQQIARISRRA